MEGIGPAAAPAVPALIQACYGEDFQVTQAALRALRRIGPAAKDAAPYLAELSEAHVFVRGFAAQALQAIGQGVPLPAKPAEEDLPRLTAQLRSASWQEAGRARPVVSIIRIHYPLRSREAGSFVLVVR